MPHPADDHFTTYRGPFGVVRACHHCSFSHKLPVGRGFGRGHGMREGNKSRGILIQHIKAEHPEVLEQS